MVNFSVSQQHTKTNSLYVLKLLSNKPDSDSDIDYINVTTTACVDFFIILG